MKVPLIEREMVSKPTIRWAKDGGLPEGVLCRVTRPLWVHDEVNRNKRRYRKAVPEAVLANPEIQRKLKERCLYGDCEHPEGSALRFDPKMTSHIISDIRIEEKVTNGDFDVFDNEPGRFIATLLKAGCGVGSSTRADGELEEATDEKGERFSDVKPGTYDFKTSDWTADPSTLSFLPEHLKESVVQSLNESYQAEKLSAANTVVVLEALKDNQAAKDLIAKIHEKVNGGGKPATQAPVVEGKPKVETIKEAGSEKEEPKKDTPRTKKVAGSANDDEIPGNTDPNAGAGDLGDNGKPIIPGNLPGNIDPNAGAPVDLPPVAGIQTAVPPVAIPGAGEPGAKTQATGIEDQLRAAEQSLASAQADIAVLKAKLDKATELLGESAKSDDILKLRENYIKDIGELTEKYQTMKKERDLAVHNGKKLAEQVRVMTTEKTKLTESVESTKKSQAAKLVEAYAQARLKQSGLGEKLTAQQRQRIAECKDNAAVDKAIELAENELVENRLLDVPVGAKVSHNPKADNDNPVKAILRKVMEGMRGKPVEQAETK